jgi:HEAT repeat protein
LTLHPVSFDYANNSEVEMPRGTERLYSSAQGNGEIISRLRSIPHLKNSSQVRSKEMRMSRAVNRFSAAVATSLVAMALVVCCRLARSQDTSKTLTPSAARARNLLKEGIESKDPDTRIQAIIAASMIGRNERVLTTIEQCLQDKDVQVRIAAIQALADLKSPGSKPALEKTLKDDNVPEVAFASAKALYALQDPAGEKALMDVYNGKVNTSSNFFRKETRALKREFHSVQSAAMFVVSQGMGYVPVPGAGEGFSAMMQLVNDPDLSERASALLLLGRKKNPQSVDLLKKGLTDGDWSVRATAAQLIAHTAQIELRESLVPLFDDKKDKVQFRAAGAYLHLYLQERSRSAIK